MSHPAVHALADGVMLDVRVIPRSGRSGVAGTRGAALLVRLQAPPVDDAANRELVSVLARFFDVPRRSVSIAGGVRARQKRVKIEALDAAAAGAKLEGS